ncbi:hypothetical protein [Methylocapsa sp. S129]|uniref:hypothetical protein n=1 Tax=Methylocapsa sp. S129 TaxID=1641869 RepID=UPI00131C8F85|nr:hypothetical protein [Methylocapsa sp. S129]
MAATVFGGAGLAHRMARFVGSTAFLLSVGLTLCTSGNPAAAQSNENVIVSQGEAVVSGFSGAHAVNPVPQGVDPVAVTFIDPAGPSARVIDLRNAGGPPQAQVLPALKPFTITAAQVGQVFAVALDKASPPNIYLAASSSYGLPIVLPALNAGDPPQRLTEGAPGAAFMPGLFGPAAMQGGPGSIWRVDGASGQVALFANVTLDGAPNSGPALGGLAFDPASNSLFAADRDTGMIHRFGLNGAEIGRYDHGKDGRAAAGLPPVALDPTKRLDISSPNFRAQDPATWAYAPPERRIFGLAAHGGRLYYAVADGLKIWSVAIAPNGAFGTDARIEIEVPPGDIPSEISKIIFDDRGRMELAERGAPTGAFDFQTIAQPAASRVLRYRLLQTDGKSAPTWQADPDEYAIGFAAALRNTNGGIAIGYAYRPDGSLDTGACGGFLWTTGEQLRNASDSTLAAELAKTGPLALNGLQGNAIEAVRPDNVPPLQSLFANYFDDSGDPVLHGHLGDIAIPRGCGQSAAIPTPVTIISWWPGGPPEACPDGFVRLGRLCRLPPPQCPIGERGGGVQCCPQGTAPGLRGECEPLRGSNFTCPVGATPIQRPDGAMQCAWLARCPGGAQADSRGGCQRFCPPGEIGWPSRKCCGDGEIGLPDGQCCPERNVRDGKCVNPCPTAGETRLLDGQCCPERDVRDGKCVTVCPRGDTRLPDGQCCPEGDVRDGKCAPVCPNGQPRADGQCGPVCGAGQRIVGGQCVVQCPPGETLGRDNLCHRTGGNDRCAPGLTRVNGACVYIHRRKACGPDERLSPNGACAPVAEPPMCPPGLVATEDGRCVPNAPPPYEFGPRYPDEPMGPPIFRPRFHGNRGGPPWFGPRRDGRGGGGRYAPHCMGGWCRR